MKAIDVVYVLGKGSNWRNNEIRFSIRALEKNLQGFRKIYIIGEDPGFLKNINHIAFPDELLNNADGNIIRKVLRACQEKGLSANFLFINDDHLIMKPMVAEEIPPYHKGDMTLLPKSFFENNFWRGRLWRTKNILVERGYPALHFDCHVPIVFSKSKFPKVISEFDFEKNTGYTMKSLYGNVVHPDGPQLKGEKVVVFRPYTYKDIEERVAGRSFIAYNDDGLRLPLKEWLYRNFPEPSSFEKDTEDPFFDLIKWVISDEKEYEEGVRLFQEYGKSRKSMRYFGKGESTARDLKLEHKIKELLNYY